MTTITISNLRIRAIIGVHDWEREVEQDIVINIQLSYDAATAAISDNISDALDYKQLKQDVIRVAGESKCCLLESLCAKILQTVMGDARVKSAQVRVDKPHALRYTDSVAVTMEESRDASS